MIRILHLIDRDADFETQRGSDSIVRSAGDGFAIQRRSIGRGGDYRDVATAAAALRRSGEPFDFIHAWGGRVLSAAVLGSRCPIIFSPSPETRGRTIQWVRAISSYRHVEVICPTATLHRAFVQRGVPIERCHAVRPGVEFARIVRRRDSDFRAKLGLTDSDYVFLACGESTRAACHVEAVWATSILHVVDPKYKILIWGRGEGTLSAIHFAQKTMPTVLRVAEQRLGAPIEFESLLPAADAVLVTARRPVATLPIAISMAAALPIVSTVTPTVAELLEDRHTALMTTGRPRQIARRMLDFIEDTSVQWSMCDMSRTEAYEYFAFTRFINQFRTIYRQLAEGKKIEVPEQGPGAGLRFHGRA